MFGDLLLKAITGKTGKWEIFFVFVFPFSCGRIGRGHDFCFFLDSGLCRAFPSILCGEGRESEFGQKQKTHTRSLRYACALFRSLKKSEASVAVRPVMAGSFLSG